MEKEFIPYEQALALKELGFDEPCLGYWRNEDLPNPLTLGQYTTKEDMEYEISGQDEYHNFKNIIALAPTYSAAFRWFRETHKWNHSVSTKRFPNAEYGYILGAMEGESSVWNINEFSTYEEAELACLKKLIEIAKQK